MLVIVGGGPIGLEMAVHAVREGMEVFFCSYDVVPMLGCGASHDGFRGSPPKPPRDPPPSHSTFTQAIFGAFDGIQHLGALPLLHHHHK